MTNIARFAMDNLLEAAALRGKNSVKTQYACQVLAVSDDGRFVDVIHNTLEYVACPDGDTVLINEYGQDVLCAAVEPWIITGVPVEQPNLRGQWDIQVRPKVGDNGILSVFYHDITTLKEKGGFQPPASRRTMVLDSASWRPGLPNHKDVDAGGTYATDDEWILKGNGVQVKLTAPATAESNSPQQMEVSVGSVNFTITVPQSGDPTVTFDIPNGTLNVNAKTANVTATDSVTVEAQTATVTAPTTTISASTSATIDAPTTTVTGTLVVGGPVTAPSLAISGAVTASGNMTLDGDLTATNVTATEVTANGFALSTHIHSGGTINGKTGAPTQ